MPTDYFETSAVLKLYRREVGTSNVEAILRSATSKPFVSRFAVIEALSVFNRFVRKGTITIDDYRLFEGQFLADLKAGTFDILAVEDAHFDLAEHLILTYGIQRECQAPDAIHLAIAVSINRVGELREFVSPDRALLSLAAAEGLPTRNPEH